MTRENVLRFFEEKRFRFYASEADIPLCIACSAGAFWVVATFFHDVASWKQSIVFGLVFAESARLAVWSRRRFFGKHFNEKS